jgi:hypothetical protein
MKKKVIVETLPDNFYGKDKLLALKQDIERFHPCVFAKFYEDTTEIFLWLKHDYLDLRVSHGIWKKKYDIYMFLSLPYVQQSYYKAAEPKNIGVLSAKKIDDWIKYHEGMYYFMQTTSNVKQQEIDSFYESIKFYDFRYRDDKKSGSFERGGLEYSFIINDNGYIQESIKVAYKVNTIFSNFVKLSNNGLHSGKG